MEQRCDRDHYGVAQTCGVYHRTSHHTTRAAPSVVAAPGRLTRYQRRSVGRADLTPYPLPYKGGTAGRGTWQLANVRLSLWLPLLAGEGLGERATHGPISSSCAVRALL